MDKKQRIYQHMLTISDKQFFTSSYVKRELEGELQACLRKYLPRNSNYKFPVIINYNTKDEEIAYTDNDVCYINSGCSFVRKGSNRIEKWQITRGLGKHELGHRLYTDFSYFIRLFEGLQHRNMLIEPENDWTEMKQWLETCDDQDLSTFLWFYKQLSNALEDGYIEQRFLEEFPHPNHVADFKVMRNVFYAELPTYKECKSKEKNEVDILNTITSLLLSYCLYGQMKCEASDFSEDAVQVVISTMCDIEDCNNTWENEGHYRAMHNVINTLFPYLKAYIEEYKQSAQNNMQQNMQQSMPSQGTGGSSSFNSAGTSSQTSSSMNGQQPLAPQQQSQQQSQQASPHNSASQGHSNSSKSQESDDTNEDQGSTSARNSGNEQSTSQIPSSATTSSSTEEDTTNGNSSGQEDNSDDESANESDSTSGNGNGDQNSTTASQNDEGETETNTSPNATNEEETDYDTNGNSGNSIDSGTEVPRMRYPNAQAFSSICSNGTGFTTQDEYDADEAEKVAEEAKRQIQTVLSNMATERVEQDIEKEHSKELKDFDLSIDYGEVHRNVDASIRRQVEVSEHQKDSYEQVFSQVSNISNILNKKFYKKLKDMSSEYMLKGLYFGNKLCSSSFARMDKKYYGKRHLPDKPSMSVGLVIDESGSMSGLRIQMARLTALIVEDFCRNSGIRFGCIGHSVPNDDVRISVYADFNTDDKKDRYRLMGITTDGCNRDGYALKYMAERMKKEDSDIKLLLIISDGQPNDIGYRGDVAYEDLRHIKKEANRNGINVIAAAIGDDKDKIKSIYQEGFLNISTLETLPTQMLNLVKKQLES